MILLVIDMQKALVDEELFAYETFVDSTVRLVEAARKNRVEVIFVQHDAGPGTGLTAGDEGFEIIDRLRPEPGEKVFVKTINSCFGNQEFREYMERQEDKRLMIIGLQTNWCIDATVKSAFERGFQVIIPEETNSTFDNDYMTGETTYRYYNEEIWPDCFAECVTFDEAMDMIQKEG
jgi:nicotinamidase-related amidase